MRNLIGNKASFSFVTPISRCDSDAPGKSGGYPCSCFAMATERLVAKLCACRDVSRAALIQAVSVGRIGSKEHVVEHNAGDVRDLSERLLEAPVLSRIELDSKLSHHIGLA